MKKFLLLLLPFLLIGLLAFEVYAQEHTSNTVRTRVGNPTTSLTGWPTSGSVSQGPLGPAGHAAHNLVALDIANVPNTPVHATFEGIAYSFDESKGEFDKTYGRLGSYVKLVPDSNPSAVVLFAHLLSVSISSGTRVKIGDEIGRMGYSGYVEPPGPGGTHLHYEFRGIPMEPPYIPTAIIPPTCGSCSPSFVP